MDVAQLRAFAAAARLGSISSAAQQLGYSQSAVSRQLQALEREFGYALLARTSRGVRPTARGRALLPHAQDIARSLDLAQAEVSGVTAEPAPLRLGSFPTATSGLVPAALAALQRTHPALVVRIRQAASPTLADAVAARELDAALVSDLDPGTNPRADLAYTHLVTDELKVVVPRSHPLAGSSEPRRLEEFASETWVEDAGRAERLLLAAAAGGGFVPERIRRAPDLTGKLAFVAAGLGVAMVPGLLVADLRADLVGVRLADPPRRSVFWIVRQDRVDAALEQLLDALRGAAADMPGVVGSRHESLPLPTANTR